MNPPTHTLRRVLSVVPVIGALLLGCIQPAHAEAERCDPATVNVVFRDHVGAFIPNINFKIYEQELNADGHIAPKSGPVIASGRTSELSGLGTVSFTPGPHSDRGYAIRAWDQNETIGSFWFLNAFTASCGEVVTDTESLSSLQVIFRDGDGELRKNVAFSVYTQRYDVENTPVFEKKDLVASRSTGAEGTKTIYVTDASHTLRGVGGNYVIAADLGGDIGYIERYVHVDTGGNTVFEYSMGDLKLIAEDAAGNILGSRALELYEQLQDSKGNLLLGKLLKKFSVDRVGEAVLVYPAGTYAMVLKDDLKRNNVFWNAKIERSQRNERRLVTSLSRIEIIENGAAVARGKVNVYPVKPSFKGGYYREKKIGTLDTGEREYAEVSLAPGRYLLAANSTNKKVKDEFGQVVLVEAGQLQNFAVKIEVAATIETQENVIVPRTSPLAEKLKGTILLQVESRGEAWYITVDSKQRVYLRDGDTAYQLMRKVGTGVTNQNLATIPIGVDSRFGGDDTDSDGLADKLEEAIGTSPTKPDTDEDGATDSEEVKKGRNPVAKTTTPLGVDTKMVNSARGKILLQVESRGEAWYVNPKDGRRYYMADGPSAYSIMRYLGQGITNDNLSTIGETVL